MANKLVASPQAPYEQVIDPQSGKYTYGGMKWAQGLTTAVNAALDILGRFTGNISSDATVGARPEPIGVTLSHLTVTGQVDSLTNVAADVDTDHIADGTGNPLNGGKIAQAAMVSSAPVSGNVLRFNALGGWVPAHIAYSDIAGTPASGADTPAVSHQWLNSYTASTGTYGQTQPAFSDISGTLATGQLPFTVTTGTGAPASSPADGSEYFDTSVTPAHGYKRIGGVWVQFS